MSLSFITHQVPFNVSLEFQDENEYSSHHIKVCYSQSSRESVNILEDLCYDLFSHHSASCTRKIKALHLQIEDIIQSRDIELLNQVKEGFSGCGLHKIPLITLVALKGHFSVLKILFPLMKSQIIDVNAVDARGWSVLHHLSVMPIFPYQDARIFEERYPQSIARDLIEDLFADESLLNHRRGTALDLVNLAHPIMLFQQHRLGWAISGLFMSRELLYQDWLGNLLLRPEPFLIGDKEASQAVIDYRQSLKKEGAFTSLTVVCGLGACGIARRRIEAGKIFAEYGGELTSLCLTRNHCIDSGVLEKTQTKEGTIGLLVDSFTLGSDGGYFTDGPPLCGILPVSNCEGSIVRLFHYAYREIPEGTLITQSYGGHHSVKESHQEVMLSDLHSFFEEIGKKGAFSYLEEVGALHQRLQPGLDRLVAIHGHHWVAYVLTTPTTLIDLIQRGSLSLDDLKEYLSRFYGDYPSAEKMLYCLTELKNCLPEKSYQLILDKIVELKSFYQSASFMIKIMEKLFLARIYLSDVMWVEAFFSEFRDYFRKSRV